MPSTVSHVTVRAWTPSSNDTLPVTGRLLLDGRPVKGALIRVDSYVLPEATGPKGGFSYPVDFTLARRHLVTIAGAKSATIGGKRLTAGQRSAVLQAGERLLASPYAVSELHAHIGKGGT